MFPSKAEKEAKQLDKALNEAPEVLLAKADELRKRAEQARAERHSAKAAVVSPEDVIRRKIRAGIAAHPGELNSSNLLDRLFPVGPGESFHHRDIVDLLIASLMATGEVVILRNSQRQYFALRPMAEAERIDATLAPFVAD